MKKLDLILPHYPVLWRQMPTEKELKVSPLRSEFYLVVQKLIKGIKVHMHVDCDVDTFCTQKIWGIQAYWPDTCKEHIVHLRLIPLHGYTRANVFGFRIGHYCDDGQVIIHTMDRQHQ